MSTLAHLAGPQARPEPDRDRWGRYRIPHPDTHKVISWTRATTFAGSIADTYGLSEWKKRMVAYGLAHRPDLYAEAASITDPDASKSQLGKIAETAMEAAGSSTKARLGTALHAFAEQVDAGATPNIPPPWDADIAAYRSEMDRVGVHVVPEWIERIVVVPRYEVAGTFDRIVEWNGELYIADLKTGRDLSYSWSEIAIQLGLYSRGTRIFDVLSGELVPMPTVHQDRAIVMHLPVGTATCTLHLVDIAAGMEAAELCSSVRDWRKRKDLATVLDTTATVTNGATSLTTGPPTDGVSALLDGPATPPILNDPITEPVHVSAPVAEVIDDLVARRRAWLTNRIIALPADAKKSLARNWPADISTLKASDSHDHTQLTVIAEVVDRVEAGFHLPFSDPDPARTRTDRVELGELGDRIDSLPADLGALLALRDANGHALSEGQRAAVLEQLLDAEATTQTRRQAVNSVLALVEHDPDMTALLAAVTQTGDIDRPTLADVDRLQLLGGLLAQDKVTVVFDEDDESVLHLNGDIEAELLAAHGGTKKTLLEAFKSTADTIGVSRPRSVAAGMANLLLVAACYPQPATAA